MKLKMQYILVLLGTMMLSGCAFTDGNPWGEGVFSIGAEYRTPQGTRIGTDEVIAIHGADSYKVKPEEVSLEIDSVKLVMAGEGSGEGGGTSKFDPAKPPKGYTLCHNGHCHKEDGGVVPYDKVKLEIGGAAALGESVMLNEKEGFEFKGLKKIEDIVSIPFRTLTCPEGGGSKNGVCDLPKGEPQEVIIHLSKIVLKGEYDKSSGGNGYKKLSIQEKLDQGVSVVLHGSLPKANPNSEVSDIRMLVKLDANLWNAVDFAKSKISQKDLLEYISLHVQTVKN